MLDTHRQQNRMLKIAMPPQDLVILGQVQWQKAPIYHKIRLATLVTPLPRNNCHQDNPGDPDDGCLSDETYLPSSTQYSNTESDVTDSEKLLNHASSPLR